MPTRSHHPPTALLVLLGVIAVAGIIAGTVLAVTGYSSAGAYSVASACVGVLGTLVAQERIDESSYPPESGP